MFDFSQKKIVLCASTPHLLAGLWHFGRLQSCQTFMNNDIGHQAFSEFLQQYPTTPVYLLADAVAEDYRLERIPHVLGKAKQALISRKLEQVYRGLNYRAAHFISRETHQRKDDLWVFVALNNDDFLQPWLTKIQLVEAHLVGIYLLAMISQTLLKRLTLTAPHISAPHILCCEKLSSGLRQTYLHHGHLYISRLVPNISVTDLQWRDFYLAEAERMRQYLISQRFISSETLLSLVLPNQASNAAQISLQTNPHSGFSCAEVWVDQLAKLFNLPVDLIAQTPELLHMQLLVNGQSLANLAPKTLTKQHQLSQKKRLINLASVLITLLGLSAASWFFMQGLAHKAAFNQALKDTATQLKNYADAAKNFPETTISAEHLKAAVNLNKTIVSYPTSPKRLMLVLSVALAKSPEIELQRLRWRFTSDLNINDENDKLVAIPATNNTLAQTATPEKPYELGFVTAEILKFNGDYQAALNSVNDFVTALQKDKNVASVIVLHAPVNLNSYADLHGNTADETSAHQPSALFKLKVTLKAPDMLKLK